MICKALLATLTLILPTPLLSGGKVAFGQNSIQAGSEFLQSSWTTENGLPQNDVKVVQTRDGYLWLGTNGGLARFDGIRFTIFDTGTTPELKSNRIRALLEDHSGNLWIGTENGGLTKYSQRSFTTFTTRDGLPDNNVFDLAEDSWGDLWFFTLKGLVRLSSGRFITYTTRDGLPHNAGGYLRSGPDGSIWFIAGERLVQFRAGSFMTYQIKPDFPKDWIRLVRDLHVASDGGVWMATAYGLIRFSAGKFTIINRPARKTKGLASDHVVLFLKDRAGQLAFLTPNGVAYLRDGKLIIDRKLPQLSRLIDNFWRAQQAFIDREGNLWIGAGGLGLYRFKERQLTAYAAEEGLSDYSFYPITEDAEGGLWFGSYGQNNNLFHSVAGKFRSYKIPSGVSSLHMDPAGDLWIGSYAIYGSDSIYRFKEGRFVAEIDLNRRLAGAPVTAFCRDRGGNLWIGTIPSAHHEGGLHRARTGAVDSYRTTEGLISNDVRCIVEDRAGALWIGTDGGLSRFKDGRFTNYSTENGLTHNHIRDIYEDVEGTLWIGTYGGGLNRFKNGRFTRFTTRDGLFDNVVSRILEDDCGNLWMSCNRGIFRAARQELNDFADGRINTVTCISYSVADGMKTSETNGGNQPAGWKARDGRLWFPTIKGVVAVDPNKLNPLPPPVLIEQVSIDQRPVALGQKIEIRLAWPLLHSALRLAKIDAPQTSSNQADLEIWYTGLSFVAPEKVAFKYKLEGYDREWVDAGARRVAYYTSLPPGAYTFKVMAANNDGIWSAQPASIEVVIIPPFWLTWRFPLLLLTLTGGTVAFIFRIRIGRLKQRQAQQEAFTKALLISQEQERKRIAAELHDSLGQNLLIIKNNALIGLNMSTDGAPVNEQFNEISDISSLAIEEVRQITYNLRPFHLDQLGLKEAIEFMLEKAAGVSPIQFSVELDDTGGLFSKEDEVNLYRIVQESVNNIIKHSSATRAKVALKCENGVMRLTVEDNGKGFLAKSNLPRKPSPGGFGLTGIGERVRMLGAREVVHSVPGQGTTITITLKLQRMRHEN